MQKAPFESPQSIDYSGQNACVITAVRKTIPVFQQHLTLLLLIVLRVEGAAQSETPPPPPQLWREIALPSKTDDSLLNVLVERHQKRAFVKRAVLVEVNAELLRQERVGITIGGHAATVEHLWGENANAPSFVRYGGLFEERLDKNDSEANIGELFFAVHQGLIASKFYFDDEVYSLIPIYKQYHLLLQLHSNRLPNECGTVHRFGGTPSEVPAAADYRLRVLVAFSQVAVSSLKHYSWSMTPEHFAQMAIGENNLAHWRNPKRTPHLNLEKVAVLSFSELEMKRDLNNLAAERPPFDLLQRWRTEAATDLQILIRSSEDALFGMARAEADGWSSGRAFCVMTLDGYGFTPYSLAHQIEHLRPEAIEPNDNTIAPSVFQSRLNHKNQINGMLEASAKVENSEIHALKTRFFARHSIFYDEGNAHLTEGIDSQSVKLAEDPIELLKYWEILPFAMPDAMVHSVSMPNETVLPHQLAQTIEILQNDHAPKEDNEPFPKKMDTFRIMPNPTHGETYIEYVVSNENSAVRLDLVTLTGRFIARLAENANHPTGHFTIRWDATGLASGVYVCMLRIGVKMETLRFVVE
jgi:hypothetical protein